VSGNQGCEESAQPGQGAGAPTGHAVEGVFGPVPEGPAAEVVVAGSAPPQFARARRWMEPAWWRAEFWWETFRRIPLIVALRRFCTRIGARDRCPPQPFPCACGFPAGWRDGTKRAPLLSQTKPRGANRSPCLSRRRRTSSVSNRRSRGSCFAAQRRTSSGATGVDTVGVGIARTE
jgi:hypothetical protein